MHPRDIAIIMGVCLVWAMNSIVSKVVVSQIGVPPLCYGMLRCVLIALAVSPGSFQCRSRDCGSSPPPF